MTDEEEITPGYKAPKQATIEELQKLDAEDESLVKYKEQLLGATEGVLGGCRERERERERGGGATEGVLGGCRERERERERERGGGEGRGVRFGNIVLLVFSVQRGDEGGGLATCIYT